MINLPFSCNCSELKVYPNNWSDKKPSIKKDWYIFYRFYDPNFRDNPKFRNGKLVIIKRMNQFKTIQERQAHTQTIMEQELLKLKIRAYNPITNKNMEVVLPQMEIEPSTSFITALVMVEKRISVSSSTKRDLRSILRYVTKASDQLNYSDLPISIISRKHKG